MAEEDEAVLLKVCREEFNRFKNNNVKLALQGRVGCKEKGNSFLASKVS